MEDEPERWADVVGSPGYRVSTYGRVKNPAGRLIGKPNHMRGYVRVSMRGNKQQFVHQLVLEAFVGPCPPGRNSRHGNGIPTDNRLSNLSWGTPLDQASDRKRHGHTPRRSWWLKGEQTHTTQPSTLGPERR